MGSLKVTQMQARTKQPCCSDWCCSGWCTGVYLDNKEKQLRQQMAGTGVEVNRNPMVLLA